VSDEVKTRDCPGSDKRLEITQDADYFTGRAVCPWCLGKPYAPLDGVAWRGRMIAKLQPHDVDSC